MPDDFPAIRAEIESHRDAMLDAIDALTDAEFDRFLVQMEAERGPEQEGPADLLYRAALFVRYGERTEDDLTARETPYEVLT